jgi:hypothetical protein
LRKIFLILALLMVGFFAFAEIASAAEGDFTFDPATGTITGYTGPGGDVEIPSQIGGVDVIIIGVSAFSGNTDLTSVVVPEGVTTIRGKAFDGCVNLANVSLPDSLSVINDDGLSFVLNSSAGAFNGCVGLTSITIPKNVTVMSYTFNVVYNQSPFTNCANLTTIIFADGITKIPSYVCLTCPSLTNVVIPDSVTQIGRWGLCYNFG